MLIKIQVSEQEVQLIIDALAEHGKPLVLVSLETLTLDVPVLGFILCECIRP